MYVSCRPVTSIWNFFDCIITYKIQEKYNLFLYAVSYFCCSVSSVIELVTVQSIIISAINYKQYLQEMNFKTNKRQRIANDMWKLWVRETRIHSFPVIMHSLHEVYEWKQGQNPVWRSLSSGRLHYVVW